MTGPPTRETTLEPLLEPPAVSKRLTATFNAVPTQRWGLLPAFTGHGSGCKSSRIEFKANSHSLTGTKNLLIAGLSPLFNGSVERVNPN